MQVSIKNIKNAPLLKRTSLAKGIKKRSKQDGSAVNRTGGDYGGGLIRGFAVVTRGEALGHGVWLDQEFLQSVSDQINATTRGHKSRFTHPGLSSDGLGKFLGRSKNATVDGDVVRADEHFAKSAHKTPDGDLAGYLMDRAEEDPESFGSSISYMFDAESEDAFVIANGGYDAFMSPDPLNTGNLPHARLKEMRAVDIVDDPAANPSGLFQRGQQIAIEAEKLAAYTLGLSKERPEVEQLGIHPDRAQQFINRFLEQHGLEIVPKQKKGDSMSKDPKSADKKLADESVDKPAETQPVDKPAEPASEKPADKPAEKPEEKKPEASPEKPAETQQGEKPADGKRFLQAFGPKGAIWFVEGKTFAEAQELQAAELKAENETLRKEKAALNKMLGRGETAPVSFSAEQTDKQKAQADLKNKVGSDGLAAFAAGIDLPGKAS